MKELFKKILAIGLAASITMGLAVTSVAEENENTEAPKSTENVEVWVNGKDVKENKDKGIKADLNKTANVLLADLLTTQEKATFSAVETYEGWKIDTTSAKGEGVLTYDYRVAVTAEDLKVEIADSSKLAVGTYTYVAAVVDNEETTDVDETAAAKWVDSNDKALDEKAVKITGTPKANDKIEVILDWYNDLGVTVSSVDVGYEFKVGDKITIVQDVQIGLSKELPEKTKYVVSVIDAPVAEEGKEVVANTLEDAFDDKGKAVKTEVKRATAKFDKKTSAFKVTAGKVAGNVEVWIAEFNSTKKAITAYASFDVTVKEAPKKFSVVIPAKKEIKDEETGEVLREATEAIEKKYTTVAGDSVMLEVAFPEGATKPHEDATYTWSVKVPKDETAYVYNNSVEYTDAEAEALEKIYETANVRVEGMNDSASIEFAKLSNPAKGGTYTITCVNDQSGKKASFKITVVNNITDIQLPDITVANAYTEKQSVELALGDPEKGYTMFTNLWEMVGEGELKEFATTDKVKAYVSSNIEFSYGTDETTGEKTFNPKGFTFTSDEKKDTFKLTEKCKEISAKLDKEGKLTVSAKKGILPGTQAKLILVATHKDKRIDLYEAIITVGTPAEKIEVGEKVALTGTKLVKGETLTLDPKITGEGADVVFLTENKGIATVDEKGVVTAKKAGTVKITVKSGKAELVYEITVINEAPAETTTTPAAGDDTPETTSSSDSTTEEPTEG